MAKQTQAPTIACIDRLLPMSKVIELTSLLKATIYRKVAEGDFSGAVQDWCIPRGLVRGRRRAVDQDSHANGRC